MSVHYIENFNDLHKKLSEYRSGRGWIFRGHEKQEWELKPKAGRAPYDVGNDLDILQAWKRRAIEYVNITASSDWDWLAIAQHHGLATRLLDWSYNPLVAVFFAIANNKNLNEGACVYAFRPNKQIDVTKNSPDDFTGVALLKPNGVAPRISRQGGLFTVHSNPKLPLDNKDSEHGVLEKLVLEGEDVRELMFEINHYGINYASIFPDLDGLSKHVNWHTENQGYWKT